MTRIPQLPLFTAAAVIALCKWKDKRNRRGKKGQNDHATIPIGLPNDVLELLAASWVQNRASEALMGPQQQQIAQHTTIIERQNDEVNSWDLPSDVLDFLVEGWLQNRASEALMSFGQQYNDAAEMMIQEEEIHAWDLPHDVLTHIASGWVQNQASEALMAPMEESNVPDTPIEEETIDAWDLSEDVLDNITAGWMDNRASAVLMGHQPTGDGTAPGWNSQQTALLDGLVPAMTPPSVVFGPAKPVTRPEPSPRAPPTTNTAPTGTDVLEFDIEDITMTLGEDENLDDVEEDTTTAEDQDSQSLPMAAPNTSAGGSAKVASHTSPLNPSEAAAYDKVMTTLQSLTHILDLAAAEQVPAGPKQARLEASPIASPAAASSTVPHRDGSQAKTLKPSTTAGEVAASTVDRKQPSKEGLERMNALMSALFEKVEAAGQVLDEAVLRSGVKSEAVVGTPATTDQPLSAHSAVTPTISPATATTPSSVISEQAAARFRIAKQRLAAHQPTQSEGGQSTASEAKPSPSQSTRSAAFSNLQLFTCNKKDEAKQVEAAGQVLVMHEAMPRSGNSSVAVARTQASRVHPLPAYSAATPTISPSTDMTPSSVFSEQAAARFRLAKQRLAAHQPTQNGQSKAPETKTIPSLSKKPAATSSNGVVPSCKKDEVKQESKKAVRKEEHAGSMAARHDAISEQYFNSIEASLRPAAAVPDFAAAEAVTPNQLKDMHRLSGENVTGIGLQERLARLNAQPSSEGRHASRASNASARPKQSSAYDATSTPRTPHLAFKAGSNKIASGEGLISGAEHGFLPSAVSAGYTAASSATTAAAAMPLSPSGVSTDNRTFPGFGCFSPISGCTAALSSMPATSATPSLPNSTLAKFPYSATPKSSPTLSTRSAAASSMQTSPQDKKDEVKRGSKKAIRMEQRVRSVAARHDALSEEFFNNMEASLGPIAAVLDFAAAEAVTPNQLEHMLRLSGENVTGAGMQERLARLNAQPSLEVHNASPASNASASPKDGSNKAATAAPGTPPPKVRPGYNNPTSSQGISSGAVHSSHPSAVTTGSTATARLATAITTMPLAASAVRNDNSTRPGFGCLPQTVGSTAALDSALAASTTPCLPVSTCARFPSSATPKARPQHEEIVGDMPRKQSTFDMTPFKRLKKGDSFLESRTEESAKSAGGAGNRIPYPAYDSGHLVAKAVPDKSVGLVVTRLADPDDDIPLDSEKTSCKDQERLTVSQAEALPQLNTHPAKLQSGHGVEDSTDTTALASTPTATEKETERHSPIGRADAYQSLPSVPEASAAHPPNKRPNTAASDSSESSPARATYLRICKQNQGLKDYVDDLKKCLDDSRMGKAKAPQDA